MASPNINMRDPILYRIRRAHHHRTGDTWCIYPMYDYAHPISDALERITHSICTLEFEDHRPLYDWLIQNLPLPGTPQQIEFARLNLTYTVMSKRKLLQLVQERHVSGWDDPRMPTISGLRRRGYTPDAIRRFADEIGVARRENVVDVGLLEFCVRDDLNRRAPRAMARSSSASHRARELPGRPGRGHGRRQQPGGSVGRHAQGAVLEGAVHRARRLPCRSAEEVLPAGAGARGSAPQRVPDHVPRGGDGRARRDRRAALHLRSGDAGRRCAGRTQGQGDPALGVRGARGRRRGPPVRPAVQRRESRRRRHRFSDAAEPRIARSADRLQSRAVAGRRRPQARASSSSDWATLRSIPIHGRAPRCSTER